MFSTLSLSQPQPLVGKLWVSVAWTFPVVEGPLLQTAPPDFLAGLSSCSPPVCKGPPKKHR